MQHKLSFFIICFLITFLLIFHYIFPFIPEINESMYKYHLEGTIYSRDINDNNSLMLSSFTSSAKYIDKICNIYNKFDQSQFAVEFLNSDYLNINSNFGYYTRIIKNTEFILCVLILIFFLFYFGTMISGVSFNDLLFRKNLIIFAIILFISLISAIIIDFLNVCDNNLIDYQQLYDIYGDLFGVINSNHTLIRVNLTSFGNFSEFILYSYSTYSIVNVNYIEINIKVCSQETAINLCTLFKNICITISFLSLIYYCITLIKCCNSRKHSNVLIYK